MEQNKRPGWDNYFMQIAQVVASRSTCLRRQVGAVLVRERHILTTGYNGAPAGMAHCADMGCLRAELDVPAGERHELCRGLHAEQNAIIQAAVHGISICGSTLYVTHQPCVVCSKMLINAGIKRIVYGGSYPDNLAWEMLQGARISLEFFPKRGEKDEK
ncbi:MAG: deoxycytidylate deaminase [bacterium]|jgi:dCMP deaminase